MVESILAEIINKSAILSSLKEIFKDYIDIYVGSILFFICVGFLYKNFDIKIRWMKRIISCIYLHRNQVILIIVSESLVLLIIEFLGFKELIYNKIESSYYKYILFGFFGCLGAQIFRYFIPKNVNSTLTKADK